MSRLARIGRIDWFKVAKTASLIAALALVAQSEWTLALAVGWPPQIAWAAPVALDAYVLAAIRARQDLGPSVVVSALSVLGSHAVYAAPAAWQDQVIGGHSHLIWKLAAACSVVPLLVTWRVHHLRLPDAAPAGRREMPDPPTPPAAPEGPEVAGTAAPEPDAKASETPKACPTREAARQILLDMDPVAFETTSNAELGRLHGGSDNWWGKRRREVAGELAKIGGAA